MTYPSTVDVLCVCPFCRKEETVRMAWSDYLAWHNGEMIQNVTPYLSAAERETLISGLCPTCQDSIFGGDNDE